MKVATFTKANYTYKPIDELPMPDYEPFGVKAMIDDYSMATRLLYRYSRPEPRPFNIVASRSCPFSCSFCIHGHDRPRYRARSVDNIMQEIKDSYEKYHFNVLILLDELFAVNKKRMIEFCEGVLEGRQKYGWDFDWMFQTHASAKLDIESLKLAKQAGCFFFSYGLESASPEVLKSMNKRIKVEQVIEAIGLAEQAGIGFGANLIFGDIAETKDTFAESIAFWLKYCRSSMVFLGLLKPYPGSKLFDVCVEKGIIKDKNRFYETIDKVGINMTEIPNSVMQFLTDTISTLERAWVFVRLATDIHSEKEKVDNPMLTFYGGDMFKVWARCPYCGQEVVYRQMMTANEDTWMGTGCTHCGRKIRIEIPKEG